MHSIHLSVPYIEEASWAPAIPKYFYYHFFFTRGLYFESRNPIIVVLFHYFPTPLLKSHRNRTFFKWPVPKIVCLFAIENYDAILTTIKFSFCMNKNKILYFYTTIPSYWLLQRIKYNEYLYLVSFVPKNIPKVYALYVYYFNPIQVTTSFLSNFIQYTYAHFYSNRNYKNYNQFN